MYVCYVCISISVRHVPVEYEMDLALPPSRPPLSPSTPSPVPLNPRLCYGRMTGAVLTVPGLSYSYSFFVAMLLCCYVCLKPSPPSDCNRGLTGQQSCVADQHFRPRKEGKGIGVKRERGGGDRKMRGRERDRGRRRERGGIGG